MFKSDYYGKSSFLKLKKRLCSVFFIIYPNKDKNFVSFGNYQDVKNIIKSNNSIVFITGLSGNGKTMS